MIIVMGSKNVLNSRYFSVIKKYAVSDPASHTNRGLPLRFSSNAPLDHLSYN